MFVLVWAAGRSLRKDLEVQTVQDLERMARLVKESLGDDPEAWQLRVRMLGQSNDLRITLIAPDGTVVADSDIPNPDRTQIANHGDREEVQAALRGEVGRARRTSETVGTELLYIAIPGGPGVVRVASNLRQANQLLDRSLRSVAWAAAFALVVGSLLAIGAARAVTSPLRDLAASARAIAAGNLPRFPRSGVSDIDALVISLREMNRQLNDRFEELRREQSESSAVVGAMVEGVLVTDPRGRIVTANPAARAMLGYGERDHLPDLQALFKARGARAAVESVLAGKEVSREIQLDSATLLIQARPLPNDGAVVVLHDLTDLRRLEIVRRDFVANVSHELKTPLTSIAGYTDTLLTDTPDDDTARQFLETIQANATRMQHLVDDLLDLSRIESGRWQPTLAPVAIGPAAEEEWANLTGPEEGVRRFMVTCHPPELALDVDRKALHQILTNLFDNAIRHTEPGGNIGLQAEEVSGGIRLRIIDDGTGIPSEHLPRIFERFYRADQARSRAQGGTGLGLAIVKHLMEAHGGSVGADSRLGDGTTITCWFPRS
jgi:signal transduction histidine kinase